MPESLPRLAARTGNFRRGVPNSFVLSPDGARVLFLRTASGTSGAGALWSLDVATGGETLLADPVALLTEDEELTAAERVRRERLRIAGSGIVSFSTDRDATRAAFALSSRLFVVDVADGRVRELQTAQPVFDPRLDPTGHQVAYAGGRSLRVVTVADNVDRELVGPAPDEPDEVVWGQAEFIAGEELERGTGYWWAPNGRAVLVERYDETPVSVWHVSDPAYPEREPARVRYPQAGTANAVVGLAILTDDGTRVDVDWRSDTALDGVLLEYLVHVEWSCAQPVLTLLTRDQRHLEYRAVDVSSGVTTVLRTISDDAWVELLPGTPRTLPDGRLLHAMDVGDTRRLYLDDDAVTPPDVLITSVLAVQDDAVIAQVVPQLGSIALARLGFDGSVALLSDPAGVAGGTYAGGTLVCAQQDVASTATRTEVRRDAARSPIASVAEPSPVQPVAHTFESGDGETAIAVLFPTGHVPGSGPLPMLLDPYGGPHGQRVVNAGRAYVISQWFADQGFVVVVADGRGTPGRGPEWERRAKNDRTGAAEDQAAAVRRVAAQYPDDVDTSRVAVRGWSFGGYLAALCVLRHPDVFHAAVAGAPTTDERLYDTAYSERYLGHPDTDGGAVYEANSLIPLAPQLRRPLMIIHGLADDNVYIAHSLRLSNALLAAGRPHEVLPLSGITHMAGDEVVAENLLLLQLDFLRRSLGLAEQDQRAAVPST